jgi:citrate lyase beta subunit
VNTQAADLPQVLDELRTAVIKSEGYTERAKLNVAADIDTLQGQLQKPEPDKGIVQKAWAGIQTAVTAGEAVEIAAKAGMLIAAVVS